VTTPSRRGLLAGAAAVSAARASAQDGPTWDVIVVGGGNAGIPCAIFAARRGARVLVIEAAGQVGGTLFLSGGQMSAGGTKFQKSKGIEDSPQEHFDDVMRISNRTANPGILRLAVDNAPATVDWLFDAGFEARPEHPVMGSGHDPYSKKRYFWGMEGGLSILKVLEKELAPEVTRGAITILTETEAKELIQDRPGGAVTGVVASGPDGQQRRHRARNVVLTCGPYGSNAAMFERLEGVTDYADTVYPHSQGAGISMALAAGAYLRGQECHQPLFNAILADTEVPSPLLVRLTSDPATRQPWEIWVNVRGERFVREDTNSYDEREKSLLTQTAERCWIVFDDQILKESPSMCRQWSKEELVDAFGSYPTFTKADSLAALAAATGIDRAGLEATIGAYNVAQKNGVDKLGRKHMPRPIATAPFYAVRMQGYYLLNTVGVGVDTSLRVLDRDDKPIANLYAAGEMLGMAAFQGQSYCGGMSVTPALTFGRLLGQKLLPLGA
jgi:fumarate reductase flavoprotein subunit